MSAPAHEGTRSFANVWRSINARASLRRTYTLRSPGNVTIGSIRMIASAAARVPRVPRQPSSKVSDARMDPIGVFLKTQLRTPGVRHNRHESRHKETHDGDQTLRCVKP